MKKLSTNKLTGEQARLLWLETSDVMGLVANTVHSYNTQIMQWLDETGFATRNIALATEKDVDRWVNPTDSKLKKSTRINRLSALQSLFRVCSAKAVTVGDPACLVRINYSRMTFSEKEPKARLPFNQMELSLLAQVTDPFWKTAILLGHSYGLRISDVAQFEWEMIGANSIIVYTDKRDKRIVLPLLPAVKAQFDSLDRLHPKWIFPDQRATMIDPSKRAALSVYFTREIKKVGVTGKSFHSLRHAFATERKNLGDSVDAIREALGHSSTTTTLGYIHP